MTNIGELGKKKLFKNLLDKLNSGKTLSANERRQFDELSEQFSEQAKPAQEPKSITVNRAQLSDLLRVTGKTINEWVKIGMPKEAHGTYDLFASVSWWHDNINSSEEERDTGITEAKRRHWNARADKSEMEVEQARGLLISKDDVIREWTWRASELRTSLLAWASRLPPSLEGKAQVELRLVLRDAVHELLRSYCRNGRFTPERTPSRCTRRPAKRSKKSGTKPKRK